MAETIRDVIIRTRIEVVGGDMKAVGNETKTAVDQAKQLTDQTKKVKEELKQVTEAKKAANAQDVNAAKAATTKQLNDQKAAIAAASAAKKAAIMEDLAAAKAAIEQEKAAKLAAIKVETAEKKAAAALQPKDNTGAFGLEGAPKGVLGATTVVVSAATAVFSGPGVLDGLTNIIKGIRADIAGGSKADGEGFFTGAGNRFATELGLKQNNARPIFDDAETLRRKELQALQEQKEAVDKLKQLREEVVRKELEGLKEQKTLAEQNLKTVQATIDKAKEEFGLMNRQEQAALKGIAEKVKASGVGSLSNTELEFARKSSAFSGLIADETKKNADAGGFAELIAGLGLTQKRDAEQAKVDALVKQEATINVNLDATQDLAKQIADKMDPILERLTNQAIATLEAKIKQSQTKQKFGSNIATPTF